MLIELGFIFSFEFTVIPGRELALKYGMCKCYAVGAVERS